MYYYMKLLILVNSLQPNKLYRTPEYQKTRRQDTKISDYQARIKQITTKRQDLHKQISKKR